MGFKIYVDDERPRPQDFLAVSRTRPRMKTRGLIWLVMQRWVARSLPCMETKENNHDEPRTA